MGEKKKVAICSPFHTSIYASKKGKVTWGYEWTVRWKRWRVATFHSSSVWKHFEITPLNFHLFRALCRLARKQFWLWGCDFQVHFSGGGGSWSCSHCLLWFLSPHCVHMRTCSKHGQQGSALLPEVRVVFHLLPPADQVFWSGSICGMCLDEQLWR